ncbi:toxin co-regulated pilus biosynthesis Q family protein [Novosphingobium acidiphilum]|uniref:toxin co-regulated pilus biosynthesis Q family protein n=1 Tax=Novosphingobium acidiphilum TaxID=505248 RepID=UPI00146FAF53
MVVEEEWAARANEPLSSTLTAWAQRAGWEVVWESDADFRLSAGATITGDFPSAADRLLSAFARTTPHLKAKFYNSNRVLRVWDERNEP